MAARRGAGNGEVNHPRARKTAFELFRGEPIDILRVHPMVAEREATTAKDTGRFNARRSKRERGSAPPEVAVETEQNFTIA